MDHAVDQLLTALALALALAIALALSSALAIYTKQANVYYYSISHIAIAVTWGEK